MFTSKLRSALAMKDRNLRVRNMAWIFAPEPWLTDGAWVSDDILFRNISLSLVIDDKF